jgi:hypothetical protein
VQTQTKTAAYSLIIRKHLNMCYIIISNNYYVLLVTLELYIIHNEESYSDQMPYSHKHVAYNNISHHEWRKLYIIIDQY